MQALINTAKNQKLYKSNNYRYQLYKGTHKLFYNTKCLKRIKTLFNYLKSSSRHIFRFLRTTSDIIEFSTTPVTLTSMAP